MTRTGPKSRLDDIATFKEIRKHILDGMNYSQIQEIMEIPAGTWDDWTYSNYKDFGDKLRMYKIEKRIMLAETNADATMKSDDERLRWDASKFILETAGKKDYSKRTEMTGADGKDLTVIFDNSFKKDEPTS